MGSYFIQTGKPLLFNSSMTFSDIQNNIGQYLVGSFILAFVMSIIFGLLGFLLLTIFSAFKNKNK